MNSSDLNKCCGLHFWDLGQSWDTPNPDFSLCFEKTVLVWGPCLLLWILSPIEIYLMMISKCRDIPWGFTNTAKLFVNLVLIAVSAVSLLWSAGSLLQGSKVFSVDIWTPVIQTGSFILAAVILIWDKLRGLHTSGVLFMFWLSLALGGALQFRTELIQVIWGTLEEPTLKFVLYMIYYPAVIVMFILNIFADPPPKVANYPKQGKVCPELQASFLSKVLYSWFNHMIWKGFRRPLTVADLWKLRPQDSSSHVVPKFEKRLTEVLQKNEKKNSLSDKVPEYSLPWTKKKKPVSVVGSMFKTFWVQILVGALLKMTTDYLAFINPHILHLIMKFVAGKDYMWKGFMYAICMFVAAELQTIALHKYIMVMYVVGFNWRTALMSSLYKKALRISSSARQSISVGEAVNLMAVDAQRCADFGPQMHIAWTSPITIIIALYFLWGILGIATLAGLAVMAILIPINIAISKKVRTLQLRQMKLKDERVKLINEVLSGMKVLKLYAWEPSFEKHILKIREDELSLLRSGALWNASTSFFWLCSSFLVSFATFGVFVLIDERNVLTSEIAFVSTALFNVMRFPISQAPLLIQTLIQFLVAIKRINTFMNADELDLSSVSHDGNKNEPLAIEAASFSWSAPSPGNSPVLRNITLRVQPGQLVAVVGAVGSGKTSLISAFLGEMIKISGNVNTLGKIAYVPQQAWIQNATVRENILFGQKYNKRLYNRTVDNCCLRSDFDMFSGGDSTEIGEKGINLSGGQRQRLSLARAVYNNADIYLLDDPLSAVDSHVGKHIFENVIGPESQLQNKTRVLVTHSVTFLHKVDVIVVMKSGEITEMGTFKELMTKKGEFSEFLVQHIVDADEGEIDEEFGEHIDEETMLRIQRGVKEYMSVKSVSSMGSHKSSATVEAIPITNQIDKLIQEEKTETGSVHMDVYAHYMRYMGLALICATLVFTVMAQTSSVLSNIWLSQWTSDSSAAVDGVQVEEKLHLYFGVYTALGFGQVAAVVVSAYTLAFGTELASRYLHKSMLTNVLHCPMSFFDTTPTGRLVNRFGKDIDVIDNLLPYNVSNALSSFSTVVGTVVAIIWSTPIFATVIIPIGLIYYLVQMLYVTCSRQLKRIESVSRSPILSHFGETLCGASSIRAYGVETRFIQTLEDRVDQNQLCQYPSIISNRWMGIRLETVGNLLILFAAVFAVLGRDTLDASIVGLSVSYALQITSMMNSAVRMASELSTNIVSVERVKEYSELPEEAAWEVHPKPSPDWPSKGVVHIEDYQVRYRKELDLVLKGISCTVNGGEKIGIVGRTGAGKSSLTLCLFRIIEAASGSILIDGLDISKIGLGDLRSKLTIIPQDPVLFSGTLRMNLDPFEAYSDSDVWRALELAHLSEYAKGLPLGLHHIITEGGDNFSVGQRQLICLARAILRKTKLLVLDEATAAIDLETDDLIQETIRQEFRDCTVLTIAHRLNTIMDSDRVIVLDKGFIKEFDSPANLLKLPSSIFYGMAKDAGLV